MYPKTALDPAGPAPAFPQTRGNERVEIFAGPRARRALAVGPLLSIIVLYTGGALHPKDYSSAAATLRSVADHQTLWAVSHILMTVGAFAFALTAPGFLLLARGRGAAAIRVGAAAAAVGMIAVAIDPVQHGILASLLVNRHVPAGLAAQIFDSYEHHWLMSAVMPLSFLLPLGFLLVAIGQLRGGHRLAGWALIAGTVVAFGAPASQALFALAGLPLMIALGMAARRAFRAA